MLDTRKVVTSVPTRRVFAAVQTDPGCVREANEDCGRHVHPTDDLAHKRLGTLTIVADGMGGHASGEVASKMAVEMISQRYYGDHKLDAPEALKLAIQAANESIFEASQAAAELAGMGTTVIALVLQEETAFCAHVGDSRLYRFRDGVLELLTMDHSQVMEMVKHGIISIEQAQNHDDKNIILRAVGTQPTVDVEVSDTFETKIGDTFLLCSDGLSDMLTDAEIESILQREADVHAACETLIAAAKERGGHDNITAGLVRIGNGDGTTASKQVRVTRDVELAS
jgi:PPM family protein phosphatase